MVKRQGYDRTRSTKERLVEAIDRAKKPRVVRLSLVRKLFPGVHRSLGDDVGRLFGANWRVRQRSFFPLEQNRPSEIPKPRFDVVYFGQMNPVLKKRKTAREGPSVRRPDADSLVNEQDHGTIVEQVFLYRNIGVYGFELKMIRDKVHHVDTAPSPSGPTTEKYPVTVALELSFSPSGTRQSFRGKIAMTQKAGLRVH